MAKLEAQKVKKQKAKKRRHSTTVQEDEVANKSVILECAVQPELEVANTTESPGHDSTKRSKKRRNKDKCAIKEKRPKPQDSDPEDAELEDTQNMDLEHSNAVDELRQPTLEELRESEKPENTLAIITGRQKKKQKHQKLLDAQKDQSIGREKQRIEEYLSKWKNSRAEWKFEKLRQISIQQSMFEEDKLSSQVWSTALEYLAGSRGAAKDKIVKMANDVIDEIDKSCEEKENEAERQELVNSVKYQRARDLLQIFD